MLDPLPDGATPPGRCVAAADACGTFGDACDRARTCADGRTGEQCAATGVCPSGVGVCRPARPGDTCVLGRVDRQCGDDADGLAGVLACVPRPPGAPPPAAAPWEAPGVGPAGVPVADGVCAAAFGVGSPCVAYDASAERYDGPAGGCPTATAAGAVVAAGAAPLLCVGGVCVEPAGAAAGRAAAGDECLGDGTACGGDDSTCAWSRTAEGARIPGNCAVVAGRRGAACGGATTVGAGGTPAVCDAARGLGCVDGACAAVPPASVGDACFEYGVPCAGVGGPPLMCAPSDTAATGYGCAAPLGVGDACSNSSLLCAGGSACIGGTCAAPAGEPGWPCGRGAALPACRAGLACAAGVCTAATPPGGRCVDRRDCVGDGTYCVGSWGGEVGFAEQGTCVTAVNGTPGDACAPAAHRVCADGLDCTDGRCGRRRVRSWGPPAQPAWGPCATDADCGSEMGDDGRGGRGPPVTCRSERDGVTAVAAAAAAAPSLTAPGRCARGRATGEPCTPGGDYCLDAAAECLPTPWRASWAERDAGRANPTTCRVARRQGGGGWR